MTPGARLAAAIDILTAVLAGSAAEKELTGWARRSRFAGSKDRAAVRDVVFDCLRQRRSLAALAGSETARGLALGWLLARSDDPTAFFTGQGYAPAELSAGEKAAISPNAEMPAQIEANLPDWIWDWLHSDLGRDEALRVGLALSHRAPTDLRVNLAKGAPDAAEASLASDGITVVPVPGVPTAFRVTENPRRVAGSAAFRDGLVELQDAASQAVVDMLPLAECRRVLDYCAGGGGKTLAIAASAPAAQVDAWDVSRARLLPLIERARRAGVSVELLDAPPTGQDYDLVLVDAPCSGSGAWRRSPEAKWTLTPDRLNDLVKLQAGILDKAWVSVCPGGVLAYATCSLLRDENEAQAAAFAARPDAEQLMSRRFDLTKPGDGFFMALFRKTA